MTCIQCKCDTGHRDTYVTYGGVKFCDWDCLVKFYVEKDLSKSPEEIGSEAKVIEQ